MSKYHLHVDFDFEFNLICIISSLKDYRLCWEINRALNIELSRKDDLEVSNIKRREQASFNLFQYEDEIDFLRYHLIANKSSGALLIPELKQVDYLLIMRGDAAGQLKDDVISQIKGLTGIEAIFDTNPKELRSKQNLIFE